MRRRGVLLAMALVWRIAVEGTVSLAGEHADWGREECGGNADDDAILPIDERRSCGSGESVPLRHVQKLKSLEVQECDRAHLSGSVLG